MLLIIKLTSNSESALPQKKQPRSGLNAELPFFNVKEKQMYQSNLASQGIFSIVFD